MSLLDKAYYALEEVESRWALSHRDVVYLAENGLLRLSVRLYAAHLECGVIEERGDGERFTAPTERTWFDGLQDLRDSDAYRLFREGQAAVEQFVAPEGEYRYLREPTERVVVRQMDVVIRREERDRVEREHGLLTRPTPGEPEFGQDNDYREVRLDGRTYRLGPLQARVVKRLYEAERAGEPWCVGKAVLGDAGSASIRMADVFKSQPDWRRLIASDRRGRYRLNLPSP